MPCPTHNPASIKRGLGVCARQSWRGARRGGRGARTGSPGLDLAMLATLKLAKPPLSRAAHVLSRHENLLARAPDAWLPRTLLHAPSPSHPRDRVRLAISSSALLFGKLTERGQRVGQRFTLPGGVRSCEGGSRVHPPLHPTPNPTQLARAPLTYTYSFLHIERLWKINGRFESDLLTR
jgi:hypothetical protein